jgi:ABC-type cobalamin/Fe3+-siderophores transport system ATPase subunit
MNIESIHLRDAGPLNNYSCDFTNTWEGGLHDLILVSGVNGAGKSTLLRAVAHLWQMTGSWLSAPKKIAKNSTASRKWLQHCRAACVILTGVPHVRQHGETNQTRLGIFYGDGSFFQEMREKHPNVIWIGEMDNFMYHLESLEKSWTKPTKTKLIHTEDEWLYALAKEYRELILVGGNTMPNLIHLDSEERRWVKPSKGLGEIVPDDPTLRWLVNYRPQKEWQGQLEASLIALKTVNEGAYLNVLNVINSFLHPKKVESTPDANTLRLKVRTQRDDQQQRAHSLDDLSSGEHQILIQLYMVTRWMNPGAVVMIDEPDLHLHPSLLNSFLSQLERIVRKRKGQLILTSHNPEIWSRYENKGLRIRMGEGES